MTVTVRLFASYAEKLGRTQFELTLPSMATVADVIRAVAQMPGAIGLPPSPLVAVNLAYANASTALAQGDEVAISPPVAGG
jgi:molybdopterin converting factor small subunit